MGTKTTVQRFDDITGEFSDDVESVTFTLDGKAREIDLSPASASAFRELFAPYVAASRLATVAAPRSGGKRSGGSSAPRPASTGGDPDKIRKQAARAWAIAQGMDIPERGRLRADVIEKWEAAGSPMPDGSTAPAAAEQAEPTAQDVAATVTDTVGVPAAGSADEAAQGDAAATDEPAGEQAETPKRGRRGRTAATTPQRPDVTAEPASA